MLLKTVEATTIKEVPKETPKKKKAAAKKSLVEKVEEVVVEPTPEPEVKVKTIQLTQEDIDDGWNLTEK